MKIISLRGLQVLGENRVINVDPNGLLKENLKPLATMICTTDLSFADFELSTSIQKTIDTANSERKRPMNVAFEDSGVILRVSSQEIHQPSSLWIVDGLRGGRAWQAKSFTGNEWVEMNWPKSQEIGRVVVYTDSIADAELQVAEGVSDKPVWRTVANASRRDQTIQFSFSPVLTSQIRLVVTSLSAGKKHCKVTELEAYKK
jgi:hypothetical protein